MWRPPSGLTVLIIGCLLACSAKADIIYTFNTTSAAPLAGPVSGSFVVSDSAIVDSFITAAEITSFNFILPSATSPFAPATFAPSDVLTISSPFAGAIPVDSITGNFRGDSSIQITDSTTTQRLGLTTFPGTVPPLVPQYLVSIRTGPLEQVSQGRGAWTVSQIPEPSAILLVGTGLLTLFGFRRGKAS